MNLLSPMMLLGVLFAAVPLIIHLLNRSRYKIEPFGAMMFLQAAVRERAQAIKLRQLLLLLMRMFLFMLLAMALARPVSNNGRTAAAVLPTTHVVVVDGSFSMQQTTEGGTAFDQAIKHAGEILDGMATHDNMLIVWAGNKPRLLQPAPTYDKALLRRSLNALQPGREAANLPAAIRQGLWALEASTLPVHRLYLLTDGQLHGWHPEHQAAWQRLQQHRELLPIPPQIYVVQTPTKPKLVNIAPVAINSRFPIVDVHRRAIFEVDLENFSDEPRAVRVQFAVDGDNRHLDKFVLQPGRTTHRFDHQFQRPGDHAVTVRVLDDDLTVDNELNKIFAVRETIPILVVEGQSSNDPFASSGGLLALALESASEPGNPSLFHVATKSHLDVTQFDLPTLQEYRCIILANVPSVSQRFAFQLEQYAERGGGILFTLGDRVSPAAYAPLVKEGTGILPAQLGTIAEVPAADANPTFAAGAGSLILANFDLSRTRVLRAAKVLRHWLCTPHENALSLGKLNQSPLLVYRDYGRGRVALWTTSVSIDWTNFPVTPDFLPLVHDLVAYLSATPTPSSNIAQGAQLLCSIGENATAGENETAPRQATIFLPDGTEKQLPFATEGNERVVRWQDTTTPGIYRVEVPDDAVHLFSVTASPEESQLASYTAKHQQVIERALAAGFVANKRQLDVRIAEESGVKEWWRILVFGALVLLCLELLAGRIFSQ